MTDAEWEFRELFAAEYGLRRSVHGRPLLVVRTDHGQPGALHDPGTAGVELLDRSGRRLDVQGNGLTVTSVAELPEARTVPTQPGRMELRLKWFNWCGEGPTRMRWIGTPGPGQAVPLTAPRCTDRSKPSRLMVDHILR